MYKTIQGDTWDLIAKKVYGDEMMAGFLMHSNHNLLDIAIFPAGVEINTPVRGDEVESDLPEWRE